MGFFRRQEERMARRFLEWKYEKAKTPMPGSAELDRHAKIIVDEAHRITRERGGNVVSIIKELVADIQKNRKGGAG
ncbi:MAG: hypothetical protein GY859_14325 [Desulfobacterales bacterium]|nr:hypothetical protein [Desulfobacterales bacterium]